MRPKFKITESLRKSSVSNTTQKPITESIESSHQEEFDSLASEIDQLFYDYDLYDYRDSFDSREDGLENAKSMLRNYEPVQIINLIKQTIDHPNDDEQKQLNSIESRINKLFGKGTVTEGHWEVDNCGDPNYKDDPEDYYENEEDGAPEWEFIGFSPDMYEDDKQSVKVHAWKKSDAERIIRSWGWTWIKLSKAPTKEEFNRCKDNFVKEIESDAPGYTKSHPNVVPDFSELNESEDDERTQTWYLLKIKDYTDIVKAYRFKVSDEDGIDGVEYSAEKGNKNAKKLLALKDRGYEYTFHPSDEYWININSGKWNKKCEVKDVDISNNVTEDTVKQNSKWVNKGKEGTHGIFKTKKEADSQRKAMFANGYTEDMKVNEKNLTKSERHNRDMNRIFDNARKITDAQARFLNKHGVSKEETDRLKQGVGIHGDAIAKKIDELGLKDAFWDEYKQNESIMSNGRKKNCSESFDLHSLKDEDKYPFLDRLRSDCDYIIKNNLGKAGFKHLWAKNPSEQIEAMKYLYSSVKEKPEWITMDDINRYEKALNDIGGSGISEKCCNNKVKEDYNAEQNLFKNDLRKSVTERFHSHRRNKNNTR